MGSTRVATRHDAAQGGARVAGQIEMKSQSRRGLVVSAVVVSVNTKAARVRRADECDIEVGLAGVLTSAPCV